MFEKQMSHEKVESKGDSVGWSTLKEGGVNGGG